MIIIPGKPRGKQRVRVTKKGWGYTPKETVEYEKLVKCCYIEQCGEYLGEGCLGAEIIAYYEIPKSKSQKVKREMLKGEELPTKKPDLDNIAKIILDSLNGTAYKDDSQICELRVSKAYSLEPRVEVKIWKK